MLSIFSKATIALAKASINHYHFPLSSYLAGTNPTNGKTNASQVNATRGGKSVIDYAPKAVLSCIHPKKSTVTAMKPRPIVAKIALT